jgi:hypothetical protein
MGQPLQKESRIHRNWAGRPVLIGEILQGSGQDDLALVARSPCGSKVSIPEMVLTFGNTTFVACWILFVTQFSSPS